MNPFNPSFGKVPQIYLDRTGQVEQVVDSLENPNSPYQTSLIYGMRGVGKTAFLTDVSQIMSEKKDWVVVDLAMGHDMINSLIGAIYSAVDDDFRQTLSTIEGVTFSIMGVQSDLMARDNMTGYQFALEEVLKKLQSKNKSLLVTIDEVNATPEMIELTSIYQIMIRKNYRISLVMTGLPDKVSELQNNDVLTFLLRSGRVVLSPLNSSDVKIRYRQVFEKGGFKINDEILNRMVELVKGYAYAFQLLGYLIWEKGDIQITESTLKAILDEYKLQLYRNAYSKVYQEMSEKDREFVSIMAHSKRDSVEISYIREQMQQSSTYVAVYRRRLKDSQIILVPSYGHVEFSLPLFSEFVMEYEMFF